MKSQTERPVRRSTNQRPARSSQTAKRYNRQTARFEGRRDGKPLIFGWGGHLSHTEKIRLQRRATWVVTGLVGLLIVAVVVGFWLNINVIVPGLPITSVNGHAIPQSQYRKLVALKAQLQVNAINGARGIIEQRKNLERQDLAELKIVTDMQTRIMNLMKQIKALPAGSPQLTDLNNQLTSYESAYQAAQVLHNNYQQQISDLNKNVLPAAQQDYTQSQIGNDSATWLQDDEIMREWLVNQSSALQAKINPTSQAIDNAINAFKADFPSTTSYDKFLSSDSLSNGDVQDVMALKLRRDNMQSYLAAQIVSPAYQVLARQISVATPAAAQSILKQLKSGGNFGAIAKAKSLDTDTNQHGGSWGWLTRGQLAQRNSQAILENWIFDQGRRIDELGPVLKENGDYHIVQILGIDPSRIADDATLNLLKNYALSDWLLTQRALPTMKVGQIDQDKLLDPANMPPGLPAAAPSAPGAGAPGGLPGGSVPGGGPPGGTLPGNGGLPGGSVPGIGG